MKFESIEIQKTLEEFDGTDYARLVRFSKITEDYRRNAEFAYNNKVSTGFPLLDQSIRGIKPGEVVYITSPTNVGKTALAMNIIRNNLNDSSLIPFFSLENNEFQMYERMLQMELSVPPWEIEERFAKNDREFIQRSENVAKKWDCVINIIERVDINDISKTIKTIEKLKNKRTKFVMIDYLQLIKVMGMNEYARMSEAAQVIKELSLKLNLPFIILSQVSRNEARKEDGLDLYSAKGSGEIENSAQILFALEKAKIEKLPASIANYAKDFERKKIDILVLKTMKKKRGHYTDIYLKLDFKNLLLTEIHSTNEVPFKDVTAKQLEIKTEKDDNDTDDMPF